jgi:hypothetical protein
MRTFVRTFGGFLVLERASGQFIIDGQVEDILGGISGAARIARISQSCRFSGQLDGESMAEFTAVLPREGDGSFHGFQRVSGTLGEREGTFVLSVSGEIHKGQPRGSWTIVPKSGSGDFTHIRGSGTFSLPDGKPGKYQLEFDLRKPRAAKTAAVDVAEDVPSAAIEEANATPADVIEAPVAVSEKPARKPRSRKAGPPIEIVSDAPEKRPRSGKAEPEVQEQPAVAVEPAEKRAGSRKAKPALVDQPALEPASKPKRSRTRTAKPALPAQAATEPVPTPKRSRTRKAEPEVPAQAVTEPAPKPKRSRKPVPAEKPVEPVAAAVEPVQESKPIRRKKAAPVEPIVLPVTEAAPNRKRRAKAA